MGNGETVLVIGRHANMLKKIVDMLNQTGYQAIGCTSNEEAIRMANARKIDAVVIGGGVDPESRSLFHSEFPKINPDVKLINAHPQTVLSELQVAFS